ncbi:M23 family metallopeptidase [Pseudonocardia dioxanivorans]|uniref:Peptidase M23 n=1 Tax=Pseudonocardia dioxanivorans (strain ATCC 55486 / DSM 44775 / JCM 13855 / CB1190) TaxID=675635 RepID=F4CXF0_PSEUX|nr:M23 family metallopeptidase [Pseudonocardia dioxanivorans]AEA26524.1 Peptidase M23 [Pseudonocardia dioxanivorans CB1190]
MGRHRRTRLGPRQHLGALAVGAASVALPVASALVGGLPTSDDGGDVAARWAPVAMTDSQERHPATGTTPVRAVAAVEAHEPVEVESLTKATRIADRVARVAALREAAAAQGSPGVAVTSSGRVFALPTTGRLTSAAGPRWGTTHYGLDIANAIGTPVFAVSDGVVVDSGPASGFGLWVRIRHPDGSLSVYGHIDRSLVTVGRQVRAGDRIALMGNRGQSTGPHLHLEIWSADGSRLDPATWLTRRGLATDGWGTLG